MALRNNTLSLQPFVVAFFWRGFLTFGFCFLYPFLDPIVGTSCRW